MTNAPTGQTFIDVLLAAKRAYRRHAPSSILVRVDVSPAAHDYLRRQFADGPSMLITYGIPWIVDETLPDMTIVKRYADGSAVPGILSTKGGAS